MRAISILKITVLAIFSFSGVFSYGVERDAIEIDALKYSHKKRFAEISPYVMLTSFGLDSTPNSSETTERLGAGASFVVGSINHSLFEAGLAYLPTGAELKNSRSVELNYLALPFSLKFFPSDQNLGFYLKSAVTLGYLMSASGDQNQFKDFDSQIWLGGGGLFDTQMENRIQFDVQWARSLSSISRSENVYNEGLVFSVGLTL